MAKGLIKKGFLTFWGFWHFGGVTPVLPEKEGGPENRVALQNRGVKFGFEISGVPKISDPQRSP